MKTNDNTNNARMLTLEELETLPRGSVIWRSINLETDEGIVWHDFDPMMICVSGPNGKLIGADAWNYFEYEINNYLMEDSQIHFWDIEPNDAQLPGITRAEYDALTDEERIVNTKLAAAITSKGMLFEKFCETAGIDYRRFWSAITGSREFVQSEIVTIRTVLSLSDEETREIFFPEEVAQI